MKKLFALFVLVVASTAVHAQKYHYDINGDGMVNVSDVTTFVNNILGVPNGGEEEKNYVYDVNGDGMANVTDVTCLVNKILGVPNPGEDTKPCRTCPDDHHPHMIDLGLPSGTMWACCNVGADKPEAYGGYYAWGETKEHEDLIFDWSTYTLCKGSDNTCMNLGSDIAGTRYDVAHVKWGGSWVMPSTAQIKELIHNCTYEWTTVNGLKGGKLTSMTTGGSIFLPATGYRWHDKLYDAGGIGGYWASTPGDLSHAYRIYAGSTGASWEPGEYRFNGLTVRPVSCPRLQLSTYSLRLTFGAVETVEITSGSGSYSVACSDEKVTTAAVDGTKITVKTRGLGYVVITVTDLLTGIKATIEVNVTPCPDDHHPHMIDLGLPSGTKWACCNVDTENPESQSPSYYGGYYAWGETEEKASYSWANYTHCEGIEGTSRPIGDDIAGTEYDVAHVKWGGAWVIPSSSQFNELLNNCTSQSTTMDDVVGQLFTGPSGGTIFLPAAGYRWGEGCIADGEYGYYWSSTRDPSSSDISFILTFDGLNNGASRSADFRFSGISVRPASFPDLILSNSVVSISMGFQKTVDIVWGSGSYTVASSDPGVATAVIDDNSVIVTATGMGKATITVTDVKTGQTVSFEVAVLDNISFSTNSLHLAPGAVGTVEITSGSGSYTVESRSPGVATATLDGSQVTVSAISYDGTAVIAVTDMVTGQIATIKVTVSFCPDDHHPHMIDLGLPSGTKWACCNVDTDQPENQSPTNYGGHYAWGETETKTKTNYSASTYQYYKNGSYQSIGSDIAGTEYDVAHVKWGGSWVMASHSQQQELFDNCTSTWTTLNGVGGRLFTGTNGGSIFLPAAGYRYDSGLFDAGSYGGYWSSSQNPSSTYYAYCLFFYSGSTRWYHYDYRNYGQSVRPVVRN